MPKLDARRTPTIFENGLGVFYTVAALVSDVRFRAWCIRANFRRLLGHLHLCLLLWCSIFMRLTVTIFENELGGFFTVAALVSDVRFRMWCIKANFRRLLWHLHLCLLIWLGIFMRVS